MTDIVERLRQGWRIELSDEELCEAADEIERLRAETQELKLQYLSDQGQWIEETGRLRAALRKIAKSQLSDSEQAFLFKMLARAALGEEE